MTLVLPLSQIKPSDASQVGGKCFALAKMAGESNGSSDRIPVPVTVCISAQAYRDYVSLTGLRERIMLELGRKDFGDMRWEELWDASLRIRNMFLKTPLPGDLFRALADALEAAFHGEAVAVRSSAPGEDSARVSFAGLHESFINITGTERILEHMRLVWSSLWSDAALLYRRDLGLDVANSAMAVVVQELVKGDRSGVAFSRSPANDEQAVIEAVYGLNQGLVDGTVEPDRWIIDRATGEILSHVPASRENMVVAGAEGVRLEPIAGRESLSVSRPPLTSDEVGEVFQRSQQLEALFGGPQDVEWTWGDRGLIVLQSRPITTLVGEDPADERRWYLSLRRSFENLQALRDRIEGELIPAMIEAATDLARQPVDHLSDADLAEEIDRRQAIYEGWVEVYWDEFIPFAHGIRLFGQVYNDAVHPDDPYAFVDLLANTEMTSLARNRALEQMAATIRRDAQLAASLRERVRHPEQRDIDGTFERRMEDFVGRFGDLSCTLTGGARCGGASDALIKILLEMASGPRVDQHDSRDSAASRANGPSRSRSAMREEYLARFEGEERVRAAELLDLARTSYQLRDDDNIYLGRIEAELVVAVAEGRQRLAMRDDMGVGREDIETVGSADVARALRDPDFVPEEASEEAAEGEFVIRARQLIGQPAGPGVAHGPARVVAAQSDLLAFKQAEILVCDAVDPNMTFVVPLAAGVVERRGGMLIHGAIIAREYGLPCVTGVPDATSLIRTGDKITVDGHLGIVTLTERGEAVGDPR